MTKLNGALSQLVEMVTQHHGQPGAAWVSRLPHALATCTERWRVRRLAPVHVSRSTYVATGIRTDGKPVVVKAAFPDDGLAGEVDALQAFGGRGAVRLLEADLEQGVLLLERLEPGTSLRSVDDDQRATAIAAQLMPQLWCQPPPDTAFPTIDDWACGLRQLRQKYDGGTGPLPARLVDTAEGLFPELVASMASPVLLHGDLHHDNILAAQREPWLAIDPKGLVGEPAYEVGAFLRNPLPTLLSAVDPRRLLSRRIDQFVEELGLDRGRVVGWALAQAVLAAWWSLEAADSSWEPSIQCAEWFSVLNREAG